MKNSIRDFWRTNGFYVSFGLGIVALVAALAIYNVNSRRGSQNQNINLNEPIESNIAKMETTKDIALDITTEETSDVGLEKDMDVPMDMQQGVRNNSEQTDVGNDSVTAITDQVVSDNDASDSSSNGVNGIMAEAGLESGIEADVAMADDVDVQETLTDNVVNYTPLENLTFLGMEEVSMPVLGNTILPYSMDTTVYYKTLGLYRCNPGMLLQSPVGTEVVSIWHGQVTNIQDSKEYGTLVTINLGSGYEMIYGQLQDVRVAVGDEVYKDTVLGTVAEPTAYYQEEGSHVYFEMTKDGEPINPLDVLQLE